MFKDSGFTLIELMVVMAIMAIISGIATPSVIEWMQNQKFKSSVQRSLAVLNAAKIRAIKENTGVLVRSDRTAQDIRAFIEDSNPPNNIWNTGTDILVDYFKIPPGVRITRAAFNGQNWILFDGRGMPNESGSIQLTKNTGDTFTISVNVTGKISLEN